MESPNQATGSVRCSIAVSVLLVLLNNCGSLRLVVLLELKLVVLDSVLLRRSGCSVPFQSLLSPPLKVWKDTISHIVVAHIEVPPPLGVTGWKSLGEVVAREGLLLLDWCIHLAFEQVEL